MLVCQLNYFFLSIAPTTSINLPRQLSSSSRQESFIGTREYYAAPTYTEASLLERKESMMRRGVLKSVIE